MMTTLGKRNAVPVSEQPDIDDLQPTLRRAMFAVLDKITAELKRRFTDTAALLLCCDSVNPSCEKFLEFDAMKSLADAYSYLAIDIDKLKCQAVVARNMFSAMPVLPDSPQAVLQAIHSMKCAFPDLVCCTVLRSAGC